MIDVKETAVRLAQEHGLINLTREMLAAECGFPVDSFQHNAGMTFSDMVVILEDEGHFGTANGVSRQRANPRLRKQQILEAAVAVAINVGYRNIGRTDVAEAAGVSQALISAYFGNLASLRDKVMAFAIEREVLEIVAQGLAGADPAARVAPQELKQKAAEFLSNQ